MRSQFYLWRFGEKHRKPGVSRVAEWFDSAVVIFTGAVGELGISYVALPLNSRFGKRQLRFVPVKADDDEVEMFLAVLGYVVVELVR